ncbi:transposase [Saccharibacter floricola]|uniref:transposase n=1 Tax=Saccharibacter floricola TaxID=231053 RepID=UPI000A050BAB
MDPKRAVVPSLLLPECDRWSQSAQDNHLFIYIMLYVLRVGCPWKDMYECYGKWNSVYVRLR